MCFEFSASKVHCKPTFYKGFILFKDAHFEKKSFVFPDKMWSSHTTSVYKLYVRFGGKTESNNYLLSTSS